MEIVTEPTELEQSWREYQIEMTLPRFYLFVIIVMIFAAAVSIGPLWYQRRVQFTVETPVEDVSPEKELDMKLALLQQIDLFQQQLCEYYNRQWRQEIILDLSVPGRQEQKSKTWAQTSRIQLDRLQKALKRKPLPHLEAEHNIQADQTATGQAKHELWFDLNGFKPHLTEEGVRSEDKYQMQELSQKLQKALEVGHEEHTEISIFEKLEAIHKKFGKMSIPLAMVDTFYEKCRDS